MANRRMLHRSISLSKQVNYLSNDFVRLLFTWIIPYLDDFGKISGESEIINAQVIPMLKRTPEEVETALQELIDVQLIQRYKINRKLIIKYPTFDVYQTNLEKRTKSKFPENPINSEEFSEIDTNSDSTEKNGTKQNLTANRTIDEFSQENSYNEIDINTFVPQNEGETAALEAYKSLEGNNPKAFFTTYYFAYIKGLPTEHFYRFVSEIKQDPNIKNQGAVFNAKVKEYFKNK